MRLGLYGLVLAGCVSGKPDDTGKKKDTSDSGHKDALSWEINDVTSDSHGLANYEVDVTDGQRSFLLTAQGPDALYVKLETLQGPGGETILDGSDWLSSKFSLTYAFWDDYSTTNFNWPVREQDVPLEVGTYTASFGVYSWDGSHDVAASGKTVEIDDYRNTETDLTTGEVHVLLVYCAGVGDDPDVVDATEQAVEVWKEVWANAGMTPVVDYATSSIDPNLPYPGYGRGDQLAEASAMSDGSQIVVVVGEDVDGDATTYGISGGIPGSLVSTKRAAIAVGWLANAGGDGTFNDNDIELYGETFAHEVGHYIGLFHVVETDYASWDALDDTEQCSDWRTCETELGGNTMFPYSICGPGGCRRQDTFTTDQSGVMQRFTGTQ